jgi:HEAT repeat protein
LLSAEHPDVAYWAATLLGRLESEASGAVSQLMEALGSSALAVRERAAWALGRIGPRASKALPLLRKLSRDSRPRLARLAAEAIGKIE